jgi:hypothetical protein
VPSPSCCCWSCPALLLQSHLCVDAGAAIEADDCE